VFIFAFIESSFTLVIASSKIASNFIVVKQHANLGISLGCAAFVLSWRIQGPVSQGGSANVQVKIRHCHSEILETFWP
jgi:hypothetical protein